MEWIEKVARFRNSANRAFLEGDYDLACFLAQQAVELVLRGVLLREIGARPLTHSLYELAKRLAQLRGGDLDERLAKCAKSLEEHYIQARYPDARLGPYERWEAEGCLSCMEELWRWIGG
ncbi:MAG: HEPN domain-containing protein [Thermoproteus sp.]